jgi:hypothetical protein
MPVVREVTSLSQFAELIGVAPHRLNGLEVDKRGAGTVTLVLEPEEPMSDYDGIAPPASFTVDHERRAHLYTADGKALVRTAGFTTPRAVQTSGTNPPLTQGGKTISGKKGKGGRRGC